MNRAERLEEEKRHWQEMRCYEDQLLSEGYTRIAGLDEAGRGPLAGPVTAAAVILPPDCLILGLDDSKKLSEKKRLRLEDEIKAKALKPSPCPVAVSAFHNNRNGEPPDM